MLKNKIDRPVTKSKNPEPKNEQSIDWIIWAAWADRITFEEIREKTGKAESEVIKVMRSNLSPSSFKLWRKRVREKSIKHRKNLNIPEKKLNKNLNSFLVIQ
ncbi:MAG: hypothetical protein FF85_04205 [alpha proteobacterium QL1]|nr:MAG: hypothetical protein FF85_04205 [alpha proteobacterium QL1]